MFRKTIYMVLIVASLFLNSGCAVIGTALAAGAAYGMSQIWK